MTVVTTYFIILSHLLSGMPLAAVPNAPRSVDTPKSATDSAFVEAQQGGWFESWEAAVAASKDRKLPLVVHFEATWCGPCRRMASDVLDRAEVKALLGNSVLGVRLDADQNRDLINEYKISTLPTELILSAAGTEQARFVGAETKANYVARLRNISRVNKADAQTEITAGEQKTGDVTEDDTRSCLIVRRDGKIVGLGGFSPVALKEGREWKLGKEEFVATFQEVEYFLQSHEEVQRFKTAPERFVPHLHGCDLVELHDSNEARTGVIELGAFYKGDIFFFASAENRKRFQDNPSWYLASNHASQVEHSDLSPILKSVVK